ncbi:type II 3-dehydroquinate dehydratase [uncultured Anaerofustis sp.]|uniref:type II 3-dehydroquinate dehydratase n=1 Tax=uncultured Anaerofustis sp. TaxID=904996 RepID=UPI0025D9D0A1|nr:type II 3-dehydroquinate dehydratase [uncultured Anaerofustis sp.]
MSKKVLVINGPNINMLGRREKDLYGREDYAYLCDIINKKANELDYEVEIYQSNSEGSIITKIQQSLDEADDIIINPAAYTHTSVGILDALKMFKGKIIEVHISDISEREEFRKHSYVSYVATKRIIGKGLEGYLLALEEL